MKRILVAGSRRYTNYDEAEKTILSLIAPYLGENILILSGGCRGTDQLGERFAKEHRYPLSQYLPQWNLYGKAAGPIRNRRMVEECDAIVCFWDGKSKGTASLIRYARLYHKRIVIHFIT